MRAHPQTESGQLMDLTSKPQPAVGAIDLDRFTSKRYRQIVRRKTAFYSFYMPVVCGLILTGRATETAKGGAADVLLKHGGVLPDPRRRVGLLRPAGGPRKDRH